MKKFICESCFKKQKGPGKYVVVDSNNGACSECGATGPCSSYEQTTTLNRVLQDKHNPNLGRANPADAFRGVSTIKPRS